MRQDGRAVRRRELPQWREERLSKSEGATGAKTNAEREEPRRQSAVIPGDRHKEKRGTLGGVPLFRFSLNRGYAFLRFRKRAIVTRPSPSSAIVPGSGVANKAK